MSRVDIPGVGSFESSDPEAVPMPKVWRRETKDIWVAEHGGETYRILATGLRDPDDVAWLAGQVWSGRGKIYVATTVHVIVHGRALRLWAYKGGPRPEVA